MRSAAILLFAALVAAVPYAQPQDDAEPSSSPSDPVPLPTTIIADPTISVSVSTSLNVPTTEATLLPTLTVTGNWSISMTTRHHYSHWEPIPIFSKSCDCPALSTVQYPCWATDALQRCNFEELHSFVCWTSAARGCPTPTRQCDALYSPTPITGKHPCDMGQNPGELVPTVTEAPTITAAPSVTAEPVTSAQLVTSAEMTAAAPPLRRWQDMAWKPEHYGVRKWM